MRCCLSLFALNVTILRLIQLHAAQYRQQRGVMILNLMFKISHRLQLGVPKETFFNDATLSYKGLPNQSRLTVIMLNCSLVHAYTLIRIHVDDRIVI